MPSRVMALLSMMGFGCDRRKGIDFLDRAFYKRNTIPNVFSGYIIMFYNLYVEQIFGKLSIGKSTNSTKSRHYSISDMFEWFFINNLVK